MSIHEIRESATIALSNRIKSMKAAGMEIIDLASGDPDFPTPDHIISAAQEAFARGDTHYVHSQGIPELCMALAEKLLSDNSINYEPDEIIITPGSKVALFAAFHALKSDRDEAIVINPAWVSYTALLKLAGLNPICIEMSPSDNFHIISKKIQQHVSSRTRLILINSPNNPTGLVYNIEELSAIAEISINHDLWIVSDEIYEKIVFDGHNHISIASIPGMRERTVIVNGFSKGYAMTGWRLAYAAAPKPVIAAMNKVVQHLVGCSASFTQHACIAAIRGPQSDIIDMAHTYQNRRDIVVNTLNDIEGITCIPSQGTIYQFIDIHRVCGNSHEFCNRALDKMQIALVPGSSFGRSAEGFIRLSLTFPTELLQNAMQRLSML